MKSVLLFTLLLNTWMMAEITLPVSFTAIFTQKITNPDKKEILYEGTLMFSDTDKFRWVYTAPTSKEVCSNGVHLKVVDHDLEQVAYYLMQETIDLAEILKVAEPYEGRKGVYNATYQERDYTVQLDGKGRLWRVSYYDDLDNTVLLVFEKMHYSKKKLSREDMACPEPERYDRIEE